MTPSFAPALSSSPSATRATATRRCTTCLRVEGLVRNPKRTYRIYREEGLQVRRKRCKKLTRELDQLSGRRPLPEEVRTETDAFRQADFIDIAISNLMTATLDGAILVTLIMFVFFITIRATTIALIAIPLSLSLRGAVDQVVWR